MLCFLFLKYFLELKIFKGPIDLSCLSTKSPQKIKEELLRVLNMNKIITKIQSVKLFLFYVKNSLKLSTL